MLQLNDVAHLGAHAEVRDQPDFVPLVPRPPQPGVTELEGEPDPGFWQACGRLVAGSSNQELPIAGPVPLRGGVPLRAKHI